MDRDNIQCIFQSWPELTSKSVRKYLPKLVAALQGNLNYERNNKISTQIPITMDPRNVETNHVFVIVVYAGKSYSYQTVLFTVTSSRGVKYVFILYSYSSNNNLSDTLKSRTVKDILHAYTTHHDYLKKR